MRYLLLLIVLLSAVSVSAQVSSSTAKKVVGTNTLPATCTAGPNPQVYVDTNATAGAQFYICTSANTWTVQGGSGSVSSVSVVSANGQSGSVATATTTPAITLNNPSALVATTSVAAPFFASANANPADAGAVRLGNTELVAWEAATPGTDLTWGVNASDVLITNAPIATSESSTAGTAHYIGTSDYGMASTNGNNLDFRSNSSGPVLKVINGSEWGAVTNASSLFGWANGTMNASSPTLDTTMFRSGAGVVGFGTTSTVANGSLIAAAATLTALPSDAATTNNTVCVTTTSGILTEGSGVGGLCLGTSSARYKHDINPFTEGLSAITRLQPKRFFYNKGYGNGGTKESVGFVAEDVARALPSIVGLDNKGRANTVDMMAVVPMLVNAVKELNAKLEAQQRTITQLKRRLRRR